MKHKYYWIFGVIIVLVGIGIVFMISGNAAVWNEQEYETKNPPPNEVIDTVKGLIIEKGISEVYFNEHFSLKAANVDSWSAEKGWESASINWGFKINNEYSVDYRTRADKIDEGFIVTEDYVIKDGVAYSFETKKLHEFGRLISRSEAQEKLKECLGFKPDVETPSLHPDGNLYLSAISPEPVEPGFYLEGRVNLETGELSCYKQSWEAKGLTEPPTKEPKQETSNLIYYIVAFVIIITLIIILFLKFRKR